MSCFSLTLCSKNLSLTALTSALGPMSFSRCAIDSNCALGICATTARCSSQAVANYAREYGGDSEIVNS